MSQLLWASLAAAFRRTALPLAAYYAVTLAAPLANGAARSDAFAGHAIVVAIVPPIAIVIASIAHAIVRTAWGRSGLRRSERVLRRSF